jgi:hypothetical protein
MNKRNKIEKCFHFNGKTYQTGNVDLLSIKLGIILICLSVYMPDIYCYSAFDP